MKNKAVKHTITKSVVFITADGIQHQDEASALLHSEVIGLHASLAESGIATLILENFGRIAASVDAIRTSAVALKQSPDKLTASLLTRFSPTGNLVSVEVKGAVTAEPVATASVSTQEVDASELRAAKKLVKSFEGKKGKRPNTYHAAVALIAQAAGAAPVVAPKPAKAPKAAAVVAASPAVKAPKAPKAAKPAASAPAAGDLSLADAKKIIAEAAGRKGPKSAAYKAALEVVNSQSGDQAELPLAAAKPAKKTATPPAPGVMHALPPQVPTLPSLPPLPPVPAMAA